MIWAACQGMLGEVKNVVIFLKIRLQFLKQKTLSLPKDT